MARLPGSWQDTAKPVKAMFDNGKCPEAATIAAFHNSSPHYDTLPNVAFMSAAAASNFCMNTLGVVQLAAACLANFARTRGAQLWRIGKYRVVKFYTWGWI